MMRKRRVNQFMIISVHLYIMCAYARACACSRLWCMCGCVRVCNVVCACVRACACIRATVHVRTCFCARVFIYFLINNYLTSTTYTQEAPFDDKQSINGTSLVICIINKV